jgi:hypothetical protein
MLVLMMRFCVRIDVSETGRLDMLGSSSRKPDDCGPVCSHTKPIVLLVYVQYMFSPTYIAHNHASVKWLCVYACCTYRRDIV